MKKIIALMALFAIALSSCGQKEETMMEDENVNTIVENIEDTAETEATKIQEAETKVEMDAETEAENATADLEMEVENAISK